MLYRDVIKNGLDRLCAFLLLIILSPILLILAMSVRIFLGTPVIFTQERPGRNGRPFKLYKFRTMLDSRDTNKQLLSDDQRLTRFGRWLRSLSLDELPELINILKGDMSFIGPRPLLMDYLPHYSARQQKRHEVKPGMTGWAQINGRNTLTWQDRFEYDVWYVENYSFWIDLKIVLLTIIKIIKREGINQAGSATMSRFDQEKR